MSSTAASVAVVVPKMAWSELPHDILILVARCLPASALPNLDNCCSAWRSMLCGVEMWHEIPLLIPSHDSYLRLVLVYSHRNPLLLGELVRQAQAVGPFVVDSRHLAQLLWEYRVVLTTPPFDALRGAGSYDPELEHLRDMEVETRTMEHRELEARDVTGKDSHSRTALHHAAARWDFRLTKRLLLAGAQVDARCDKGNFARTPLLECLDGRAAFLRARRPYLARLNSDRWNQERTVAALLEYKADTLLVGTHRNSALSLALTRAPCDVFVALLQATHQSQGRTVLEKDMKAYAQRSEQPAFETPENKERKLAEAATWLSTPVTSVTTAAVTEFSTTKSTHVTQGKPRRRRGRQPQSQPQGSRESHGSLT